MKQLLILLGVALSLLSFAGDKEKNADAKPAEVKVAPVKVQKADKFFANRQYREALNSYYSSYSNNTTNADLNFKIGLCYHYLLQKPGLCVKLFTNASKRLSPKYDFYSSKNSGTSYDAHYFLGKSYLAQNHADSAMAMLAIYSSETKDDAQVDAGRQIKMCVNYNTLRRQPHDIKPEKLPLPVNTLYSETNPVASIDHTTLFYASRKPVKEVDGEIMADENIYYATVRADGSWNDPVSFAHNTAYDEEPLYLTTDGKKLYLRRTDKNGKGDIYYSTLDGTTWSVPQSLKEANSKYDERGIAFSSNGQSMIVSSNRPDGIGGYDLYMAKVTNGNIGKVKNMGAKVNSPLDEVYPYFHPVDRRIYYSSNGDTKYGMGGYDVFFTQSDSGDNWSEPFTMGYPVNKGGNEMGYYVVSGGISFYTAVGEDGDFNIYELKRGNGKEEIEEQIVAENAVSAPADNSFVEVLEVEKEKIVEKEKEVEVSKVEEVKVEVEKNIGMVLAEEAKNLDNVIAIEQKEVQVQVPVEVEVVRPSGTRPVQQDDGTVINQDGTVQAELTAQNKGTNTPAPTIDLSNVAPPTENTDNGSSSSYNNTDNSSTYNTTDPNIDPGNAPTNNNSYNNSTPEAVPTTTAEPKTGKTVVVAKMPDIELPEIPKDTIDPVKAKENYELAMKQLDQAGVSDEGKTGIIANVTRMLEEKLRHERTAVFKSIYFDFNSKSLGLSKGELDVLIQYMKAHKDVSIEVVGHTDSRGSWETNFWLSHKRAKSVFDYLQGKGISTSRMIYNGKGSVEPVESNDTDAGRAKNRRVEVILIQ